MSTFGLVAMRDPKYYSVRIQVVGGRFEAKDLPALAAIAEKHGRGYVHFTTRQSVEIPFVLKENAEELLRDLKDAGIHAGGTGPRIRTISACPGTDCRFGIIKTQSLAKSLFKATKNQTLPHKFKLAVTGCPNSCAKPTTNDFGVRGESLQKFSRPLCNLCGKCVERCPSPGTLEISGENKLVFHGQKCIRCGLCAEVCPTGAWKRNKAVFAVYVGGNHGRFIRQGDRLPFVCGSIREVVDTLKDTLDWFRQNAKPRERLARTMEREGADKLIRHLTKARTERLKPQDDPARRSRDQNTGS